MLLKLSCDDINHLDEIYLDNRKYLSSIKMPYRDYRDTGPPRAHGKNHHFLFMNSIYKVNKDILCK